MGQSHLFTSESVTEGHPDKIADQISDGVLDAVLADDPYGPRRLRDAHHDGPGDGGRGDLDLDLRGHPVRSCAARSAGSATTGAKYGFDCETCGVSVALDEQSPDIAQGVDHALEARGAQGADPYDLQGAGDQGLMFGYASDETRRADAAADHPRPPPLRAPGGHAAHLDDLPAPRREVAGHRPLRGRRAARRSPRSSSPPSTRPDVSPELLRDEVIGQVVRPVLEDFEHVPQRHHLLHQPDRASSWSAARSATAA